MADTQTALQATSVPAERLLFGPPDWVAIGSGTHVAITATAVAVTGKQNHCVKAVVSSSGGTPAAGTLQITDGVGGTVIFQAELPAAVTAPIPFDFSQRPLRSSSGNALQATLGDLGASIKATIWIEGITTFPQ